MTNFVMFLKTYSGDLKGCKRLVNSFNLHNKDNIKLYISIKKEESDIFKDFTNQNIKIIADEDYAKQYFFTEPFGPFQLGYINQEICKLSFWETGIAENYLCIDSDAIFIRDFYISDFMKDEQTPYTVLVQDKELHAQQWYNFSETRKEYIKRIWDYIDYDDKRYRTCHGFQVMNKIVLKSLKDDFMTPKNLGYKDLIKISPLEFSWYNCWFQKSKVLEECVVEPFFKTFHNKADYNFARLQALSVENLMQEYVGIVLNSNWTKNQKTFLPINIFEKIFCKILARI